MFDYVIIGSGIVGCFVAQALSKYEGKIALIDKANDIANATSMANSAIIHSGYDPIPGTLKAQLNVLGARKYASLCQQYQVVYNQIGSLTVATTETQLDLLKTYVQRAKINGVDVVLLDAQATLLKEPTLTKTVKGALFAPTTAIVYPWHMAMALVDHSISNGLELKLNHHVYGIERKRDHYIIKTSQGTIKTRQIINCAGVHGTHIQAMIETPTIQITPRKGEYYVLDRGAFEYAKHIIFPVPTTKGKGVLVVPISEREILIGPSSDEVEDFDNVATTKKGLAYIKSEVIQMMDNVPMHRVMRSFSGLRASPSTKDFFIEASTENEGLYHVIGIESPGFASAPAIADYLLTKIKEPLRLKKDYKPYQATTRIRPLSIAERIEKVKEHKDYGRIICRCENISKQEIVEAIKGQVGSCTIKGIKKRVRPGSGKCQGGFCEPDIVKIIAETLDIDIKDVLYDDTGSNMVVAKSKEYLK